MALEIDLQTSRFGTSFKGAYFRIITAQISRAGMGDAKFRVMIDIAGYATATPDQNTQDIDFRRYHAPLDEVNAQLGDDFLAKCYAWVASQPDMVGAVQA